MPFLKRDRPEVEELTGQRWVPVLVHGDEVIHDSHRILEYLDWLDEQQGGCMRDCRAEEPRRAHGAAAHSARRAWPLVLMAWERWQSLPPDEKERYKRQAREYAERGRKVLDEPPPALGARRSSGSASAQAVLEPERALRRLGLRLERLVARAARRRAARQARRTRTSP